MARLWVTDVLRVCTCACRRACASVCARGERIQHVHPRRYEWMDRYAEWIDTRIDACDIEFTNARMGARAHTHIQTRSVWDGGGPRASDERAQGN